MFKCDILRSILRAVLLSSSRNAGKKKQQNAADFLGSILHHTQCIFNAFESGQQIRLDDTVMRYKL